MKAKKIDMVNGPLLRSIISFTIPIILTGVLQLFFTAADLMVVGRYCGSNSVGAVGSTTSLIHLIINVFIASKFNDIAYMKGYGPEMHCFAMCFWLGILGCLYVIALPDRGTREVQNNTSNPITNAEPDNSSTKFNNVESPEFENKKYDDLVKKAEKFKDTFYDRDYRIRVYESIVKEMQPLANDNFMDASQKLEEYTVYLELLKKRRIK
jgi:hypothetical protein